MIKSMTFLWIILAVAVSGALFRVSYRVQHLQKHLVAVNRDIGTEQEKIRVLQAEWNKLNDPQRIETLVHRHLPLGPAKPAQIVTMDMVPNKTPLPQIANGAKPAEPAPQAQPVPAPTQAPILASLNNQRD